MRSLVAIFLVLALIGCSEKGLEGKPASPTKVDAGSELFSVPMVTSSNTSNWFAVIKKLEDGEIAKGQGSVIRKGLTLELQLAGGKSLQLIDKQDCDFDANCLHYVYRGAVAEGQFYRVDAAYYEGYAVFLISKKTGEQIDVYRDPHLSQDGKYLVTASDEEAFGDPGVFLWKISDGVMLPHFRFVSEDYQLFQFKSWEGTEKINLRKIAWPPQGVCKEGVLAEYQMNLSQQDGKWSLMQTSDQAKCL